MTLTTWLRQQVERLEEEIRGHIVFTSNEPASHADLVELRSKAALHTYLRQQLLRRERATFATQEFELIPAMRRY
jgi:hypothetical protein